ncbi:unnamed protein product [Heligmosomoides polygyrus]|uniref:Coiled-coil domain-containing protein n=1 Tax=Heligmosomoides polygyrus TaxID=6339 RepID=A0A3P7XME3_HELPZ|nr:unnamed protein product [Heligmosomoides polygyrus]
MTEVVDGAKDEGFGEIDLNDGFSYDIDLIAEELEYFKAKQQGKDDGNISDTDSAIHTTPRVWYPLPVPVTESNGLQESTKTFVVSERALKLKNLHKVELLRYRSCGEQYILSADRLVFHLLAFIDLRERGQGAYDDPPLFSVCNDAILLNIVAPYYSTHMALRELVDFADRLEWSRDLPAFWEVFLVFIREFFADYRVSLSELRKQKRLSVAGLLESTAEFRDAVHLLHSLTCCWFEVHQFEWIHVELAWNNFFAMMDERSALTKAEAAIVTCLQKAYGGALLRVMDHIYSFGQVPKNWERHFILYNNVSDPELLITQSETDFIPMLWSDDLLLTVLRGAQARVRLRAEIDVVPVFSKAFYEELDVTAIPDETFIPFHEFRHAFEKAAAKLTCELSNELLVTVRAAGLIDYWADMKEVTCGSVAHCFASFVYGCTSNPSAIGALDVKELYRTALLRGGVSPARAIKWRLTQSAMAETDHCIQCDLERPLNYVFKKSLIPAMNGCMDNLFKIFRVAELLTSVSSDRKTAEDYKQVDEERSVAERRVRHMTFLVSKLLNLISIIKDLSVSNDLTIETLVRWHKTTVRSIEFLALVGKTMPVDSVFHALYLRLKYTRENVRYPASDVA